MNDASYEKFFIALQRINQVAADADSTDNLISAVLTEMLEIFQCDRAWLLYPCDPDTPSWKVVMERTRPEWPGGLEMNVEFPTKPDDVAIFRALQDSGHVLKYDASNVIEAEFAVQFSIKAQLIMAICPKMDKAWVLGIHHCAHPHVYTKAEEYLFESIGKRVSEALNHFLATRQLRESERYNRMLFENAPVGLILCHKSGLLIEANPAFAEILGYNIEEIKGLILGQALPDGIVQRGWWADEYLGKIGKLSSCGELIHKEGYRVPVQISSNPIEKDGECCILYCVENVTEFKRAVDALRQSDRELREAQRIAHVGSWQLDVATNQVVWSEELYRMLGLNPELPPPDYAEHGRLFTPESWERLTTALSITLETGVPYELDLEMVRPDGSHGWMLARGEALRDADGSIVTLHGVVVDITGRKQVETALRHHKVMIDTAIDGFWITDAMGNLQEANEAYAKMSGYTIDELVNMHARQLDAIEQSPEDVHAHIAKVIALGHDQYETRLRHKDGHEIDIEVSVTYMAETQQFFFFCRDISARKQDEQAKLRESEDRFRGTLEQAAVGIAHVSLDGHFHQVNQKFCEIVGYSRDELLQMSFKEITFPDDLDENVHYRQKLLAGEISTFSLEKRYVCKDRSLVWVNLTVSLLRAADGTPKYTIGVIEDITERRHADMELKQSRKLLRELVVQRETLREEERKRIARELHDELGQLLTALRMNVSLLRIGLGEHDTALLNKIKRTTELLDQSIQCTREVVANLRPAALDMGVVPAIKWLCDEFTRHTGTPCVLYAPKEDIILDEVLAVAVFRIVQESLTNVARYAEASKVEIIIRQDAGNFSVAVNDNGKGFEPTGISNRKSFGLLGMRERGIALGGVVNIYSAPQQGTQVNFVVPNKQTSTDMKGEIHDSPLDC